MKKNINKKIDNPAIAKIVVYGFVQGVGFRAFIYKNANMLNLKGYVLNRDDGGVEALFIGNEEDVKQMLDLVKSGPRSANIDEVIEDLTKDKHTIEELSKQYDEFYIRY